MKCVICKHGKTAKGSATVTLESKGSTLVIKSVPAQVCDNCGEQYVDEKTTRKILSAAVEDGKKGVVVDVRQYVAA